MSRRNDLLCFRELKVNDVLVHALREAHGISIDTDAFMIQVHSARGT